MITDLVGLRAGGKGTSSGAAERRYRGQRGQGVQRVGRVGGKPARGGGRGGRQAHEQRRLRGQQNRQSGRQGWECIRVLSKIIFYLLQDGCSSREDGWSPSTLDPNRNSFQKTILVQRASKGFTLWRRPRLRFPRLRFPLNQVGLKLIKADSGGSLREGTWMLGGTSKST